MRRLVHLIVMTLAAGVLVGVPAASGASASRLDCDPADGSFKSTSKRVYRHEPAGTVGIYADIKNTTRQWRSKVRGQVCFYNAKGRLIENEFTFASQLAVAPHERIAFYISESVSSSWSYFTLRFESKKTKLRAVTGHVAVTTGQVTTDANGFLEVPVSVRNDNAFAISGVNVYVTLFDKRNRIISIDTTTYNYTDPATLAPGATGELTLGAFASFEGLHHLRVSVEAFRAR